jgi:cation:H+ antiporter
LLLSFVRFDTATEVVVAFIAVSAVILFAGVRLTAAADKIADRTGLGEALVGSVLLGAATSLSGLTVSVTAASAGLAELAVSNCLGGIAAQTLFLAAADLAYRKANLEHAAASLENMIQCTVLIFALALVGMAAAVPALSFLQIHPASYGLIAIYILGLKITKGARDTPGWQARMTEETETDEADSTKGSQSILRLGVTFAALALTVAASGFVVSRAAEGAVNVFGIGESVAGAFLAAIVTSLPELVTTVAAVRRGALTLAVGGIIGGNAFDVLFIAAADTAYREGSIYAAVGERQLLLAALATAMTAALLMGLLRRERQGPAGIGFETWLVILLYFAGSALLIMR